MTISNSRALLDNKTSTVSISEIESALNEIVSSISNTEAKSRGRSLDSIEKSVARGMIAEFGIAKILGERNSLTWDLCNRDSFSYDVKDTTYGYRHEVKCQADEYWSFYPPMVKTLLNNIKANGLDTIVTARISELSEGTYSVTPTLVINPYSLKSYIVRSARSHGSFYYEHRAAIKDGECEKVIHLNG